VKTVGLPGTKRGNSLKQTVTKNIRDLYQPRTNTANGKDDDLLADSHSILNRQNLLSVIECTWP